MSDLVERLRACPVRWVYVRGGKRQEIYELITDAADTIDRLRAENERLRFRVAEIAGELDDAEEAAEKRITELEGERDRLWRLLCKEQVKSPLWEQDAHDATKRANRAEAERDTAAREAEKLQTLLNWRDDFLVDAGMWGEFVVWTARRDAALSKTEGKG